MKIFFRRLYFGSSRRIFAVFLTVCDFTIKPILKIFGIRLISKRYDTFDFSENKKILLLQGFNGFTWIGNDKYITRTRLERDPWQKFEVSGFSKNVYSHNPDLNLMPISFLESSLLQDGRYELVEETSGELMDYNFLIENTNSKAVYIPYAPSFFHFYLQLLPFLLRYKDGSIYGKVERNSWVLQILEYFKITPTWTEGSSPIPSSESISLVGQVGHYPSRDEILFLSSHFEEKERDPDINIYISRAGNLNGRSVNNENELFSFLSKLDYVYINPDHLSFVQQVELFSKAKSIVSPHGAALSHLVSVPKSCKILEINGVSDVRWHFRKIALDLGLDHSLLLVPNDKKGNLTVPLDLLAAHLPI